MYISENIFLTMIIYNNISNYVIFQVFPLVLDVLIFILSVYVNLPVKEIHKKDSRQRNWCSLLLHNKDPEKWHG